MVYLLQLSSSGLQLWKIHIVGEGPQAHSMPGIKREFKPCNKEDISEEVNCQGSYVEIQVVNNMDD